MKKHPASTALSSRPPNRRRRALATFGRWIERNLPGLYLRWSMADLEQWKGAIPWAPLRKSLSESRIALVTSGGLILPEQEPFDLSDPAGDCTFRVIPADARLGELRVSHLNYDPFNANADAEVMLPVIALQTLSAEGKTGPVAPQHISFSGAIPDPGPLISKHAPKIASILESDEVDLVLLAPA